MEHPQLTNARMIDKDSSIPGNGSSWYNDEPGIAEQLTVLIMQKFPDLANDVQSLMRGPTDICYGHAVYAISKEVNARYNMELAQDHVTRLGKEQAATMILDILAGEIGAELCLIKAVLQAEGKKYCPYYIVIPVRTVNSTSFMPEFKFKTRYGVYDPKEYLK